MIKVLIVDDERLARVELKRLLSTCEGVEVIAEAKNGQQAIDLLQQHSIDLVFLDIQMPEMTGLELAQYIDSNIQFIFCTAFNQHAVDAFELNAADYIVKPINRERLQQSLTRVQQTALIATTVEQPEKELISYLPDNHGLLLKFGDSSKIIRLQEVERFESVGNHVAVFTEQGKSYIHSSLTKVEKRLDPALFFKASRGEVIRIDSIAKIEDGLATGSLLAIMTSGHQVDVSRRQAQALKQLFNVW
ncbi:LytTR family DNA-binding domain-containing protein [Psychrobium sp. 1_MG-2023]|uniref:LytR/AlgR family response regulator transcription factor n=1 Tax=Psychrobium sp. 1_MG-2023 TaxID=3062624 RepID=UPI000C32C8A9|nr:LytTR family DNA-binding domain-containing protein [Psychrobium sp. 1_MG-2023]MDP2560492.1 LytTR family DNA-binding domain-containing protein [Psychrobium sp. 1_MG-2023]PKF55190.1 DNA-binding response regulator [Alteromonadales bacterium alter-6D02]